MPVASGQGRCKYMVEVQFRNPTVPCFTVMKGYPRSQRKCVQLVVAAGYIRHGPTCCQRWLDHPVSTVLYQALVHPVVRKELVRTIRMRVKAADSRKEACLRAWCYYNGVISGRCLESVEGVVELLLTWCVAGQPLIEDGRIPLARERQIDCRCMNTGQNIIPLLLSAHVILNSRDHINISKKSCSCCLLLRCGVRDCLVVCLVCNLP